jgi:hypothetical protein
MQIKYIIVYADDTRLVKEGRDVVGRRDLTKVHWYQVQNANLNILESHIELKIESQTANISRNSNVNTPVLPAR